MAVGFLQLAVFMPKPELARFEIVPGAAAPLALFSEALLASLFAATLLAEVWGARFPGTTFTQRFTYVYWRYALPGCVCSAVVYWLLWGRWSP